jgi:2-phosphosulfolactate phosphatase
MTNSRPSLFTCFSPALLHLYDATNTVVVIIDVLRATSTIATALNNGAKYVIPVDSVAKCIELAKLLRDCPMEILRSSIRENLLKEKFSF